MSREWENFIAVVLDDMGVTYAREVGIGGYRADFVLVGRDVVLEIDGPEHTAITKQQVRDREKNEIFSACGFSVMRIKSVDLESDWPAVVRGLTRFIKETDKRLFQ